MDANTIDRTSIESVRLQVDVLLAEYNMVRNAVQAHRQVQSQLDGLALAALGFSIPLIVLLLGQRPDMFGAIASLPILFYAIAFVQIRDERQITLDAVYADSILRPKFDQLLNRLSMEAVHTLGYEEYLSPYSARSLVVQWIFILSRAGISLLLGTGFVAAYLLLRQGSQQANWQSHDLWLPVIDIVILAAVAVAAYLPARMRFDFFQKKRNTLDKTVLS